MLRKLNEDAPLSLRDLRQLVELAKAIIQSHYSGFEDTEMIMRVVNADEAETLVKMLQRYKKLMRAPEVLRLMRNELFEDKHPFQDNRRHT